MFDGRTFAGGSFKNERRKELRARFGVLQKPLQETPASLYIEVLECINRHGTRQRYLAFHFPSRKRVGISDVALIYDISALARDSRHGLGNVHTQKTPANVFPSSLADFRFCAIAVIAVIHRNFSALECPLNG